MTGICGMWTLTLSVDDMITISNSLSKTCLFRRSLCWWQNLPNYIVEHLGTPNSCSAEEILPYVFPSSNNCVIMSTLSTTPVIFFICICLLFLNVWYPSSSRKLRQTKIVEWNKCLLYVSSISVIRFLHFGFVLKIKNWKTSQYSVFSVFILNWKMNERMLHWFFCLLRLINTL